MQRDEAIKYNALYQEVLLAISNIKNLGFDVKEFENVLKIIHNEVNNNVKVDYVKGMAEASYIQSYSKGISELNKLKMKLDNYDVYAVAYNTCNYINNKIGNEISLSELEKLVSKVIFVLKSINKSKTIDYDNERQIVEKIYETAYNVIKYEILMTGESQLYLFVKNEDNNVSYFNNLIIKDIEKIDLKKNKMIETKMFELGQNGIYSNYLDLELIRLILLNDKNYDLKSIIINNIKDLSKKIIENTKGIGIKECRLEDLIDDKKEKKENLNITLKSVKKRIVSLVLSATLILSGSFGLVKLAKKIETISRYHKNVEIYSTEKGLIEHGEENAVRADANPSDSVVLRIYDNSEGNNHSYQEYDISEIKYKEIEDYYGYVKDNYEIDNAIVEIERDAYKKEFSQVGAAILLHLGYLFMLVLAEAASFSHKRENYSWFGYIRLKNIIRKLNELKNDKEEYNETLHELEEVVNETIGLINEDTVLRNKFNELYNANSYLLDDPEKLLKLVNDKSDLKKIDNVKKLIKERNN